MELDFSEEKKQLFWNNLLSNRWLFPKGVTAKRLEKLKPLIWNNHHDFWFFVFKKPEDIGLICLDYMIKYKILRHVLCTMLFAPCSLPHAPCSLPHAPCSLRHALCYYRSLSQ